jgi:hypothetical protein
LTSQGSPYSVFKRALRRGDLAGVRAAAAELPRVPLDDAFAICLLILDQQPVRYERAAVRWLGRLVAERHHLGLRHAELPPATSPRSPTPPVLARARLLSPRSPETSGFPSSAPSSAPASPTEVLLAAGRAVA